MNALHRACSSARRHEAQVKKLRKIVALSVRERTRFCVCLCALAHQGA